MIKYVFIITFFIGFSCSNPKQRVNNTQKQDQPSFRTFLGRFKVLSLPFLANTSCYDPDSTSVKLDMDNDSTFVDYVGPGMTVGLLPDTSNFYSVIYCVAASCYLPTLAVFSKDGKRISKEQLTNGCGSDIGYRCTDSLIIRPNSQIIHKIIEETFSIDKNGTIIDNSKKKNITIEYFSIQSSGQIIKTINSY